MDFFFIHIKHTDQYIGHGSSVVSVGVRVLILQAGKLVF